MPGTANSLSPRCKPTERICRKGKCYFLTLLLATVVLTADAGLLPPVSEDMALGGLSDLFCWTFASNNAGRLTLPGALLDRFNQTGSEYANAGSYFRGNTYRADASCTLLGQEFYLARSAPAQITFRVYESASTNGPFIRIDAVTVYAPEGTGYVSSGQRGVPLTIGRFYAIGVAVEEASSYQRPMVTLPYDNGDLTCIKGIWLESTPADTVASFNLYTTPCRQRLRLSTACASVPADGTLMLENTTGFHVRGNLYAPTQNTWLLGHGLYVPRSTEKTLSLLVYESNTRTGTYARIDLQTVTVPAGTNYVSVSTQIPLVAGRFYMVGGWGSSHTLYTASGYYSTPQTFSWGSAIEGYYRSVLDLYGPPASVTKAATTNTTAYNGCVIVGDLPAVRMDTSANLQMSTNSATVILSPSGYSSLMLAFDHRESGDEPHDADGVFVSANGTTFTRVIAVDSTSSAWTHHEADIIALAQAAGVPTTGQLFVRFQQADDYTWTSDGREFANIRFYANPDLTWHTLDATQPKYLFRGTEAKTFNLAGAVNLAGGTNEVAGLPVSVSQRLSDEAGAVQTTATSFTADIPAMGHRRIPFTSSITVPLSTALTQSLYHINITLDSGNVLTEGNEDNNLAKSDVLVNQYSGVLRFNTTASTITLTDWDFQPGYGSPTYSPERHVITGTGTLAGQPFTFANLMVRKQLSTGDYTVDPAETQTLALTNLTGTSGSVAGVRFTYASNVLLSTTGVHGSVSATLPAGCAFAEAPDVPWGQPTAGPVSAVFDASLRPTGTLSLPVPDPYFFEESKPLYFDVSGLSWNTAAGTFTLPVNAVEYAHQAAMAELEALASSARIPRDAAIRRTNDGYYRTVARRSSSVVIRVDAYGAGQAAFAVDLDPGAFVTHLPYDVELAWASTGTLVVSNDLPVINPTVSSLAAGRDFDVRYGAGCPGGCAGGSATQTISVDNVFSAFYFTLDGGLYVPCAFIGGEADLRWGYIADAADYAQRAYGFKDGVLHVPGHFLRSHDCPAVLSDDDTPGALALSGVDRAGDELTRPHGPGYADGRGSYAGVTVQFESRDCAGVSLLGGTERLGPYSLDEACKFYARFSGVTGIQLADESLGSLSVALCGYPFQLGHLAFAYLSNDNTDSRTDGRLSVPLPCDFDLEFDELYLNCFGDLESVKLPNPPPQLTLAYWSARVRPVSALFQSVDPCAVGKQTLVMDVSTEVDNIPGRLFGRLGFLPSGNLSTASDAGSLCDSRLTLPSSVSMPGPSGSSYALRPASKGYFNDYRKRGDRSAVGDGLFTFAGEIDVPFFENLLVQGFTGADTGGATSPLYLVGGWPSKGWKIGVETPFTDAAFDADNAGHPTGAGAPSFSDYLAGANADYIPRARREWISGIGFDIGVRWDAPSRSFRSPAPNTRDLFVLQTEYNVPQLTAQRAEITFGLQYGELPALNLSSILFNAVDEVTGISDCFTNAVGKVVSDVLDQGVSALETVTATDPTDMLANTLASEMEPFVDDLYIALSNAHASGSSSVSNVLSRYVRGGAGAPVNNLRHILDTVVEGTDTLLGGIGLAADLQGQIDDALLMIDAVAFEVDDPVMGYADGLLNKVGNDYPLLELLGRVLMIFAIPSMMEADNTIESTIGTVMDSITPALDTVKESLGEARAQLETVKTQLGDAGEFRDELLAVLDPAQLQALADAIADRMESELATCEGAFSPYTNYTQDEIKALLRAAIVDALREASPIAQLQRVVRARMLDFDRQIRDGVDSVMAQVNWAMRETLSEVVGSLDTSISSMAGDLSDVIGTGQIEGYAHIQGDSLDKLRLDLLAQMKVPDEMAFKAFLEIVNEQATASGGCSFPEGDTYKVTLGANDVSCDWLGSDARINCFCFFTVNSGLPKGLGGGLELVGGSITFEAMEVDRFGAAVAFGALENYLAAAARVTTPAGVEIEGGLFFGRTCTLTPLLIVDPEVGTVLGSPPFTGAYVYGQGWMPIYDFGCLFNLKAGAGLGVFYFLEGPTYGVRIMLGASGEALCVVSVRGEVEIYGLKQGSEYRARGKGKIKGKVGCCPFCVKFNKTVTVTYDDGEWDVDY